MSHNDDHVLYQRHGHPASSSSASQQQQQQLALQQQQRRKRQQRANQRDQFINNVINLPEEYQAPEKLRASSTNKACCDIIMLLY